MGKVKKGIKCSVEGCGSSAVRSLSADTVASVGFKIGEERRAYLCENHYKNFKKKTKREKLLEKWRWKG